MDKEQRLYSKSNLEKDSLPKQKRTKVVEEVPIQPSLDNVALEYLKTSKEIMAKVFLLLFQEAK